jgi:uncharacterized SAM-binding protein YcdF (DUF218 family)
LLQGFPLFELYHVWVNQLFGVVQKAIKGIFILFLVWVMGISLFYLTIPRHISDEQTYTQAIVVLTGGRERLKTGFQLLCTQHAKMIFISGVNSEETLKSLLKTVDLHGMACALDRGQLIQSTFLGYTAKNTKENAEETAIWVKQMGITSVRLVTAAYHMPRSLLQLKYLLPEATIIPHPVFPYGQNTLWWCSAGAMYLILSEYHKFIWAFLRLNLAA